MENGHQIIENLIMPIPTKQKKCKSNTKAQGFESCGKEVYRFKFGMCRSCFRDWCIGTEEGKAYFDSQRIKVTALAVKKVEKKAKHEWSAKKNEEVDHSKRLQDAVNEISRLIDAGLPCLARGNYPAQMHAGHVYARGGSSNMKFNLHNVHRQSAQSNHYQNDDGALRNGLAAEYGTNYMEFITQLKRTPTLGYSNNEYKEFAKNARSIARRLKKLGNVYSKDERIGLRNDINKELGIYGFEFCGY